MTLKRISFALCALLGLLLVNGCSSSKTDTATNVPGPPSGPQPEAANTGMKDNNSVQR